MSTGADWYRTTQAGERALYKNVDDKIDRYEANYRFLTSDHRKALQAFCVAFILESRSPGGSETE